jgi:hypothetical protein
MTTAVDANIILEFLTGTPAQIQVAQGALTAAKASGDLIVSVIAYAEVAARFSSKAQADDLFALLRCSVQPLDARPAFVAGHFFRDYKRRGGTRNRMLADFLIAAHAQLNADRILTRDARFYGPDFRRLKAIRPEDLI